MSIMTSGSFERVGALTFMAIAVSPLRQLPRTGGSVMKPTLAIPARWHA
jgi:hypothetical protein